MKKAVFSLSVLLMMLLAACSVQEKMSPRIFLDRLFDSGVVLPETAEIFNESGNCVCFASDEQGTEYALEIKTDESGNVKRISAACTMQEAQEKFIRLARSIINAYSPEDSADEVTKALFKSGEINGNCLYYETQWHSYSVCASDDGVFFAVESKKLAETTAVELSLKPNDKSEYQP